MRILSCLILLLLAACHKATGPSSAGSRPVSEETDASWPQFRGPTGQGLTKSRALPLHWSEKQNVTWKVALPGQGWSSPVINDGRIWLTTATEQGHSLRALCVELATGKLLLDTEVFAIADPLPKHALNSYASPTPIVDGERVYVHFGTNGTAGISSLDGHKLWENRALTIDHENGPGGSMSLCGNRLLIPCDGRDNQYEVALDPATGKVLWQTKRSMSFTKPPDMRKAYGTPLTVEVDGVLQSVTTAADRLYAYDPQTGQEAWHVDYTGFSNIARPITGLGMLFVCSGFRNSDLLAIRLGANHDDCTQTHVVWKRTVATPFQSSPVLVGDRIYTVTDSGIAACVDARNGQEIWKERIGGEFSASLLTDGQRIYCFNRKGKTTVLQPGDHYQVIAENSLAEGLMASPAVAGHALILRTASSLYRIEDKAPQPALVDRP